MYTNLTTNLLNVACPKNKTESDCDLRKYIKNGQDFFVVSINENHLIPMSNDLKKFVRVYKEIHNICNKCLLENTKQNAL